MFSYADGQLKRIKKNIFGNSFNFSLAVLAQLFYIPLMLYSWGAVQTGYWFFFISIPQILSFWKLDFAEASKNELTINNGKNKNEIFTISLIFTFLVIFILGIIFFTINFNFINNFEIFKDHKINNFNIILILIFFSFAIELIVNNFYILSLYTGKIYKSEVTNGIFSALEKIAIGCVGFFTIHLFYAAIIFLCIKIIKFIFVKYFINLDIDFKITKIPKKLFYNIFSKSINIYYLNLTNLINVSGLTYFVGYFYNSEIVALLNALQTMFKFTVYRVNKVFIDVLYFEFAYYFSKKKIKKVLEIYRFQKEKNYIFLFCFSIFVLLFGEYIFNLWTNNNFKNFNNIMLLIMADSILMMLSYNDQLLSRTLNKLEGIALMNLIVTIMSFLPLIFFENLRINLEMIFYIIAIKSLLIFFINKYFNALFIKNYLKKFSNK
tara:strand:+ start:255 stop:1562 length:1308 start_codon:yes stop_codon:yes gene_type:complete